jgi:hypothetical protein
VGEEEREEGEGVVDGEKGGKEEESDLTSAVDPPTD